MEALKLLFEDARIQISAVAKKMEQHELLTEQDCVDLTTLLATLINEQKRCIAELSGEGITVENCLSIDQLEEMKLVARRKREHEASVARRRIIVEEFLNIRATNEDYQAELIRFQEQLSGLADEELESLEESGELGTYHKFVKFVRGENAEKEDLVSLTGLLGYQLCFAVLTNGLDYLPDSGAMTSSSDASTGQMPPEQGQFEESAHMLDDGNAASLSAETPPSSIDIPLTTEDPRSQDIPESVMSKAAGAAPDESDGFLPEEQNTLVETPTRMLAPTRPVRKKVAKAGAFRSDVAKMSPAARVILPGLSILGVLQKEYLIENIVLLGWDSPVFQENFEEQVDKALKLLADKEYIVSYSVESLGEVYCLTPYGYNCLHLQSIAKDHELFSVPLKNKRGFSLGCGDHSLVAKEQLEEQTLIDSWTQLQRLTDYLRCLTNCTELGLLTEQSKTKLVRSYRWIRDHFFCNIPQGEENKWCQICGDQESPREGVLLVGDRLPELGAEGAFACVGGELYHWDNGWERMTKSDESAKGDLSPQEELPLATAENLTSQEEILPEIESIEQQKLEITTEASSFELNSVDSDLSQTEDISEPQIEEFPLDQEMSFVEKGLPVPAQPENTISEQPVDIQGCSSQESAKRMLASTRQIQSDQLLTIAIQLMAEDRFAEAAAMIEALDRMPLASNTIRGFCRIFRQGIHQPGKTFQYSSDIIDELSRMQPEENTLLYHLQNTLVLTTTLWALVFPSIPYDHNLYNNAKNVINETLSVPSTALPMLQEMTELLGRELKELSFENDGLGFSRNILSSLANDGERQSRLKLICDRAETLKQTPTSTVGINGLETCLKRMAGPSSELGKILYKVHLDDRSDLSRIRVFLKEEFGVEKEQPDIQKLEDYIDRNWNLIRRSDSGVKVKHLDNDTPARKLCKKTLAERLAVIVEWLAVISSEENNARFAKYRDRYARILNQLKSKLMHLAEATDSSSDEICEVQAGYRILRRTAILLTEALQNGGQIAEVNFNLPLYCSSEMLLDETGELLITNELYNVYGLEPWRFLLRAVAGEQEAPVDILSQIDDYKSHWYRNFGTESLLRRCLELEPVNRNNDIQAAKRAADEAVDNLQSNTRLNRAFGKIEEHVMETAFEVVKILQKICDRTQNFASFHRNLARLNSLLDAEIEVQSSRYQQRLQGLSAIYQDAPILESIRSALKDENFVRAESYINLLQNGTLTITENERSAEIEEDFLRLFQEREEAYYRECENHKSTNPSAWGGKVLERMGQDYQRWSASNERRSALEWIKNWIMRKDDVRTPGRITNLLKGLGFQVKNVVLDKSSFGYEVFVVSAHATASNLKDYPHPVYKFGTELSSPMYVVCLFGCKGASTLIDIMTKHLQLDGATIVLMDGSLTPSDRHRVAEQFKADTSGRSPFLLIDRVFLLFLASLDQGSREKAMLRCTLPYTFEVLYGTGTGFVPEEMFIGRVQEMNQLCSDAAPDLVYGGRQLGKTALLNRASKTLHNPDIKRYSFCVEIKDYGKDVLLERTNRELERLGLLSAPCNSLQELCDTLTRVYKDGKIQDLRIFVDESDTLFEELRESSGGKEYQGLRPFINLRDDTGRHVKFVFAGTHNIAAADSAEQENSNLIHMGNVLCIEPLSNDDAIKLIRRPMSYLGFEIEQKQIELILSTTNSYPGLIHMFCNALIRSVCRDYTHYYSGYHPGKNPPYQISDEQMRAVFKEKDIRKEVGVRVMSTIRLNRRYHTVSCLLTLMIYEDLQKDHSRLYGYSPRELLEFNRRETKNALISRMTEKELRVLLDEMVRMRIVWKKEDRDQYRFRQQDFLNYIGNEDEVMEKLLQDEEDAS